MRGGRDRTADLGVMNLQVDGSDVSEVRYSKSMTLINEFFLESAIRAQRTKTLSI